MMDRINSRKADINALFEKARNITGDSDSDVDSSVLLEELSERFSHLQSLAHAKHDQFMALINRWRKMTERRKKMIGLLKGTKFIIPKKIIKNSEDARKQIDELQVWESITIII